MAEPLYMALRRIQWVVERSPLFHVEHAIRC